MDWRKFQVGTSEGEILACSVLEPDQPNRSIAVLFHGYGSSRFNDTNLGIAPLLVNEGVTVVVADLSGSGESTGDVVDQNIARAALEITTVVDHVMLWPSVDPERMAVLGNSFSGNAAILAAGQLNLRCLALKAPVTDYLYLRTRQLGEEAMSEWEEAGTIVVPSGHQAGWDSIEVARCIDTYAAFQALDLPITIWQGTSDEIIPRESWLQLEVLCDGISKQFVRVQGANHRIDGIHAHGFHEGVAKFFASQLSEG